MGQQLFQISLLVNDYDEAIEFYTKKLHFDLLENTIISDEKRWVRIAPKGSDMSLLLAKASDAEQKKHIGNQTGGRVFLFLNTDDFERDYQNLIQQRINIVRDRSEESFGKVVVFSDLYGNLWDLIEPNEK